eukprot:GFYU01004645.1.p1 GENE.GFYU01004645.1~~GFYU01004645.1.p1  ORF type:complete len:576 (-),score=85.92 GFYU01004645.1:207-1847(-)
MHTLATRQRCLSRLSSDVTAVQTTITRVNSLQMNKQTYGNRLQPLFLALFVSTIFDVTLADSTYGTHFRPANLRAFSLGDLMHADIIDYFTQTDPQASIFYTLLLKGSSIDVHGYPGEFTFLAPTNAAFLGDADGMRTLRWLGVNIPDPDQPNADSVGLSQRQPGPAGQSTTEGTPHKRRALGGGYVGAHHGSRGAPAPVARDDGSPLRGVHVEQGGDTQGVTLSEKVLTEDDVVSMVSNTPLSSFHSGRLRHFLLSHLVYERLTLGALAAASQLKVASGLMYAVSAHAHVDPTSPPTVQTHPESHWRPGAQFLKAEVPISEDLHATQGKGGHAQQQSTRHSEDSNNDGHSPHQGLKGKPRADGAGGSNHVAAAARGTHSEDDIFAVPAVSSDDHPAEDYEIAGVRVAKYSGQDSDTPMTTEPTDRPLVYKMSALLDTAPRQHTPENNELTIGWYYVIFATSAISVMICGCSTLYQAIAKITRNRAKPLTAKAAPHGAQQTPQVDCECGAVMPVGTVRTSTEKSLNTILESEALEFPTPDAKPSVV